MIPRSKAITVAFLASLLSCTMATSAFASTTQESILQDDALMLTAGPTAQGDTLDRLKGLGVDTIHSIVLWNRYTPASNASRKPAGFNGSNPAAYGANVWDGLDGLVRGTRQRGMGLILTISGPGPNWVAGCRTSTGRTPGICKPNTKEFQAFSTAVGKRYNGSYVDENGGGALPKVTRWTIWNEPNQGGWLQPQSAKVKGKLTLVGASVYRGLFKAASTGLRASGHGSDQLMIGETAPIGHTTGNPAARNAYPVPFLNALFCIDEKGKKLTGNEAKQLGCSGRYSRLAANAFSHHPYTRGGSLPPTTRAKTGEITASSVDRLEKILSSAGKRGRIKRNLPIYYTEYGVQTNPPDTLLGVTFDQQAAYINEAEYMAYKNSHIKSYAQYILQDPPGNISFETGLISASGNPKPGLSAYRLPLRVARSGGSLDFWGGARPAGNGQPSQVALQHASSVNGTFETVQTINVGGSGYFSVRRAHQPGAWRLSWTDASGTTFASRKVASP